MALRELAERRSGGLVVRLLWDPDRNQAHLRYLDIRTGDGFDTDVPNALALSAFQHPNAYRPTRLAA
jgi:hypothetical protein